MKQQIAGSKGMNTKPEECEVCKKSFKSARGVKIHQGKSGCKVALGQNRFVKSKPVAGDFQESHHTTSPARNWAVDREQLTLLAQRVLTHVVKNQFMIETQHQHYLKR